MPLVSRGGQAPLHGTLARATLVGVWHKVYRGRTRTRYEHRRGGTLRPGSTRSTGPIAGLAQPWSTWRWGAPGWCRSARSDPGPPVPEVCPPLAPRRPPVRSAALTALLTLIGVRYTTGPVEAVEAVDMAVGQARAPVARRGSSTSQYHGGRVDDFEALVRESCCAKCSLGRASARPRSRPWRTTTAARPDRRLNLVRERPAARARAARQCGPGRRDRAGGTEGDGPNARG